MISVSDGHLNVSDLFGIKNIDVADGCYLVVELIVIKPCSSQHSQLESLSYWKMQVVIWKDGCHR